jgi:pyruvate/oxaloacetate carboxyltransferase
MKNVRLYAYWRKMPAAMAPKRAMPELTWKLEAAPVEEESVEEALGKLASSVEVPVAELREEEEVAVRVAWLMVVLRETAMPVPEALAAVPAGVTMTGTEVVALALGTGMAETDTLDMALDIALDIALDMALEVAPWTMKGPK